MKKLIIAMLLLFIPSLTWAVGYQISFDLIFADPNQAVKTYDYLSGLPKTAEKFYDGGDYLKPLQMDPNNPTLRLWGLFRFNDPDQQSSVWNALEAIKPYTDGNQVNIIEKHDCQGDRLEKCGKQIIDSWGGSVE